MRMASSPGKSIRRRREICSGLHALAHRRCCRRPCRRPFQATAGPTTAAPPGVATAPDRRSCTYVRRAALVASLALFGRRAARSACHCAVLARYASPPLRVAALRRNSREIRARSWTPHAPAGERSPVCPGPVRDTARSPRVQRTPDTAPMAASLMAQVSSVACRPPPGTSGPPPRATRRPRSPRPRSTDPPQSPPRTAAGSPAAPRLVGQATPATRLVAPDPSAVSQPSSQPPLSRCCDGHLNPPWIPLYMVSARGMDIKQFALFAWLPFLAADAGCILSGYLSPFFANRFNMSLVNSRIAGIAIGALCMIGPGLIGLVVSPIAAILLFSLGAFAHQMLSSLLYAVVTDVFPKQDVATATGFGGMAGYLGGTLFSLTIGALATTIGYEPLFVCLSVFDIIALIVVWVVIGERRRGAEPTAAAATSA